MADQSLGFDDSAIPKKAPGDYMNLELGSNKFRILAPMIHGEEYWIPTGEQYDDGKDKYKPVRVKSDHSYSKEENDIIRSLPEDRCPKAFWAFLVYNYLTKKVQVLEIAKKSILKDLVPYFKDPDTADFRNYDIKIIRTGERKDTKYSVTVMNIGKEPSQEIKEAWESVKTFANLERLFEGGNPLQPNEQ